MIRVLGRLNGYSYYKLVLQSRIFFEKFAFKERKILYLDKVDMTNMLL